MVDTLRAIGPARLAFVTGAWLFLASIVIQTFLVGLDVFAELEGSTHRDFAYVYGWLAPILVLLGGAARMPSRIRWLTVALLVVFAVQTALPSLDEELPLLAALHPANALLIFALAIVIARGATDAIRQDAVAAS
jgi:heme A synthase